MSLGRGGGFRKAFKAQACTGGTTFVAHTWVVKEYKQEVLKAIQDTNETVEAHAKGCANAQSSSAFQQKVGDETRM